MKDENPKEYIVVDLTQATAEEKLDIKNTLKAVTDLALEHAYSAVDKGLLVECFHTHMLHAIETARRNVPCDFCDVVKMSEKPKEEMH